MNDAATLQVEVAAAVPGRQEVIPVTLPPGATVMDAVRASAVHDRFPELDQASVVYAVFGIRVRPEQALNEGDRVELLRPLQVDPRESRRRRARKAR